MIFDIVILNIVKDIFPHQTLSRKKANEQAGELSGHYSLGTGGYHARAKGESYEAWISRPVSIINLIEGLCSL